VVLLALFSKMQIGKLNDFEFRAAIHSQYKLPAVFTSVLTARGKRTNHGKAK
jgi:hypothetical protein